MNTADRSVSKIDLAIRRRFAFVRMMPEREAVKSLSTEKGLKIFDILTGVFLEWASDESLSLLPGQSYFIAKSDAELRDRVKYDLIPLIDEYLKEGYLGSAAGELFSARNSILDEISETTHAK
jgi:5-methylcytosine-specific restriction protein B